MMEEFQNEFRLNGEENTSSQDNNTIALKVALNGKIIENHSVDINVNSDEKEELNNKEISDSKEEDDLISEVPLDKLDFNNDHKAKKVSMNHSESSNSHDPLLEELLRMEEKLKISKANELEELEPLVTMGDIKLIFPNTLILLQGKMGSHKSRVAGEILSSMLNPSVCANKSLNLKANNLETHLVLIDTERNTNYELPKAIQTILASSCLDKKDNPKNFNYTSLLQISRATRFNALKLYIKYIRSNVHESIPIFIVIDVLSDFAIDFNNPTESLLISDYLNKLIESANCTILVILHENPSKDSSKARGHLGTELQNKASTVIQVSVNAAKQIRLNFLKTRNTSIPDPVFVEYSPITGGLISSKEIKNTTNSSMNQNSMFAEFLVEYLKEPKLRKDLIETAMNAFTCGDRKIENLIKNFVDNQIPIEVNNVEMILSKEDKGQVLYYLLKEKEMTQ